MTGPGNAPQKGRIFSLSLAHMLNDWYMNYLQTLLPFLTAAGLAVSQGAFLVAAFTITSSIVQPVSGYLVDQKNQRWMVYVGTLWMAVLLGLAGTIGNYPLALLAVSLGGLGTAAFHPQASAMVSAVSGTRKGTFQALFVAAGNVGWALTPLLAVPFIQAYGLARTPVFIVPGVLVAILLWFTAPRVGPAARSPSSPLGRALAGQWGELTKIVLVVALRSLAYTALVAFLPLYFQRRGVSLVTSSHLLFVMLFAGALGGLAGGYLFDRYGEKVVIAGSLAAASPLFFLALQSGGPSGYLFLALAGACLLASFSVTIVAAQKLISGNAAMASGLMLGFANGAGGLGVGFVGVLAQHAGVPFAVHFLIWLPLVTGLFALTLRGVKTAAAA